ncbi:glycosyltransferase [Paenibacillus dendritiformis]|uniref:glycosyltransferase family 4 protein n=1 Tax=Paenibacillus dendritiformis TaxID=130049 RepID=UPI00105A5C5D|nr:glycosyltransferase family 4 protein [Paenibacillus dendritiformis]TDL51863.1 glycosyltransferase [Paenibacillus dendritiformis]
MKIGIIKPDYKISGGFEVVTNQLKNHLEKVGHQVEVKYIDATEEGTANIPTLIPNDIYINNADFFNYVNYCWKYLNLDVSRFDRVISTQPPSFYVNHPNHISLFYHHNKKYYDLSEIIQKCGQALAHHVKIADYIREMDSIALRKVKTILAGSETIKKRISQYNKISQNVDVIYAGIDSDIYNQSMNITYEKPIVVGRHEFPKRPELFVAALHKGGIDGKVVGEGGRTEDLKRIDQLVAYLLNEDKSVPDELLWTKMSMGHFGEEYSVILKRISKQPSVKRAIFTGRVSKQQLLMEYAQALCVVCPAYEEDYGLTAIEAMSFKKPVIAFSDGGGYTELIKHGVTGFVINPSSDELARTLKLLVDNPAIAVEMGKNAYEFSRGFTWKNTTSKLLEYL